MKPRLRRRRSRREDEADTNLVGLLSHFWPEVKGRCEVLDEQVMKLLHDGCWQELRAAVIRYGRRVQLSANVVLSILITRSTIKYLDEHPEQAADIEAELEAIHDEAAARGDCRIRPLDEFIANFQEAHRKCLPTVH
jgi:hypothetical protein